MARPKHLKYILVNYPLLKESSLSHTEQLVLANIINVVQGGGSYTFDNIWIADYLNCHVNTASRVVSSLKNKGWLEVILVKNEHNNSIAYRVLTLTDACINNFVDEAVNKNVKHNTKISIGTTPVNKNKDNNTLADRQHVFELEVKSFTDYKDHHTDFIEYWTEPNKSKTKMKFEMERTWDTQRRLRKWNDNRVTNFGRRNPDEQSDWESQLKEKLNGA